MDDDITIERDGREEDGMSEEELEATESRADSKLAKIKKELEQCRKERQENLDGWQRAKADYVNALKRFEAEKAEAGDKGVLKAVRSLLPAYDALERAKDAGEMPDGFAGIAKQLESAFSSLGLEAVGEVGEAFDPALHEALGQDSVESADQDDVITAVLERGYKIGDSVLRPARVRVGHFAG